MEVEKFNGKFIIKVIDAIIHEQERWKINVENDRINEICYIYDMDYYKDYGKFLDVFGGEFVEFALSDSNDFVSSEEVRRFMKLGKPYIVEFFISGEWVKSLELKNMARYMIEEWIHLDIRYDEPKHQYDGRIEHEIPAENILCIHEVEECLDI